MSCFQSLEMCSCDSQNPMARAASAAAPNAVVSIFLGRMILHCMWSAWIRIRSLLMEAPPSARSSEILIELSRVKLSSSSADWKLTA